MFSTSSLLLTLLVGSPIPMGNGHEKVQIGGTELEIYTYKPQSYAGGPLLFVFHGVSRGADSYRDHARELADASGSVVIAPLFDEKRFSSDVYQRGGLMVKGKLMPPEQWTVNLVPQLIAEIRRREGRKDGPVFLLGHSGGAQFLVRLSAFVDTDAVRIVAANPGSHLFPTAELPYPYGFGTLPSQLANEAVLKRYLAQPLTLYLGTGDIIQDEDFDDSTTAMKQGENRYQRGLNNFKVAESLAKQRGWPFNWRLVEAPGVAHSAGKMFAHPQCRVALAEGPKAVTPKKPGKP